MNGLKRAYAMEVLNIFCQIHTWKPTNSWHNRSTAKKTTIVCVNFNEFTLESSPTQRDIFYQMPGTLPQKGTEIQQRTLPFLMSIIFCFVSSLLLTHNFKIITIPDKSSYDTQAGWCVPSPPNQYWKMSCFLFSWKGKHQLIINIVSWSRRELAALGVPKFLPGIVPCVYILVSQRHNSYQNTVDSCYSGHAWDIV